MESARRLNESELVHRAPFDVEKLRLFYAKLLLTRFLYNVSELNMLDRLLYPEPSASWQLGEPPRAYACRPESERAKRQKLQFDEVEAQTADASEPD